MRIPRHPTNIRRMLQSRVQQVAARKPLLAASLVSFERRCGKPGCHCVSGEKHRGHQLTYNDRGKTRTVYVPVDFTEEVRSWIDEHRRLKALLQEISQLSLALWFAAMPRSGNGERAGCKPRRVVRRQPSATSGPSLISGWMACPIPAFCRWSSTTNDSSFGGGSACTCFSSAVAGNWISISMPAAPKCLNNLNRFAQTEQETRPVHDTLDHFLEHTGAAPFAELRTHMLRRLIRMRSLDAARLQGRFVVALDATGHLAFRRPHCPHCLVYRHATHTTYLHQVLEAKLLGPAEFDPVHGQRVH